MSFSQLDTAAYVCKCGCCATLDQLYYCRACRAAACGNCVTELIECSYCPSCLLEISRSQTELSNCRCWRCFECPSCCNTLAQLSAVVMPEKTMRYYFGCTFCRWTSLESKIVSDTAENLVLLCMKLDKDSDHAKEFNYRAEQFQQASKNLLRERARKHSHYRPQRNRQPNTVSPLQKTLKIGESEPYELPPKPEEPSEDQIVESHYEGFPVGLLGHFETQDVTSAHQRIHQPSTRELLVSRLYPQRKSLISKRSKKCGACDRYVIWADSTIRSNNFKTQSLALQNIPRLIVQDCRISSEGAMEFLVSITNPIESIIHVNLRPSEAYLASGIQIAVPEKGVYVDAYDDVAELETHYGEEALAAHDDPRYMHQRLGHVVLLWIKASSRTEQIALDTQVRTIASLERLDECKDHVTFTVILRANEETF
eukprot:TRINITY_DN6799_c0_g1_i2.p1 TRINITY_DN6799_c0_g1~~TRINITY_DN6799_c0_g1_i2.p1  ORF type:complete len:426 (-),score=65.33 TRINITY_DN6799_c0_g1_i2:60-1337(-)